ncbi:MAG: FAD:protein FMN transferase [Planctomycetaceae bacterium]
MSEPRLTTTRRQVLSALKPTRISEGILPSTRAQPSAGITVRLTTRAMACDFSVIMNPGPTEQIEAAGKALDAIHAAEALMSIYRENSLFSELNRKAADAPQTLRGDMFELIQTAQKIHLGTNGAFDMATGALTRLWRACRHEQRIPSTDEIDAALDISGMQHLALNSQQNSVAFSRHGLLLDPGAIGKGFALDDAALQLKQAEHAPLSFLLHGGHSSLKAIGPHNGHAGWPIGIGNPLFTEQRLGTLLLCDKAMATSGSNIQFFRHEGRRYGHILDPRTGWPVDGMLSVTVLAPSAAVADALSTAFFVMGVEKASLCCKNWPEVGAILIPFPDKGRKVCPTVIGIPDEQIVWDEDQVVLQEGSFLPKPASSEAPL